jgi:hypothetical protein
MPSPEGDLDVIEHRRVALRAMPAGELRDDYLLYLDGVERQARAAAGLPPLSPEELARRDRGAEQDGSRVDRALLTAFGAILLAYGTWALTTLL